MEFPSIYKYFYFTFRAVPIILLGWLQITKSALVVLFQYWNRKAIYDKVFFLLLFLQLILSGFSWFQYEVTFYDSPETVYISPKWNFFFILISLLNFFFLGFWKSSWTRIWFFSTQIMMLIILLWGSLEPVRYFFDFIDVNEIKYRYTFYTFVLISVSTFLSGFLTFQDEDKRFDMQ